MATAGRTVIGVFDEAGMADRTIDALQNNGFNSDQIYHSGRTADSGGFLAGVRNFFTGNSTESNVARDLEGMGVSDDEANYYENEYKNGHTILAVQAPSNAENVWSIMQSNGAYNYASRMGGTGITSSAATTGTTTTRRTAADAARDINSAAQTTNTVEPINTANTTNYDTTRTNNYTTTGTANTADVTDTDAAQRLRLREEQLNVSKQPVQTGEVQLHKDVVEEQKTVNVPVTHEEVYLERRPVTDATVDNTPIGQGEEIRVPVSEEQVNVSKNTVVTGEVAIGKRAVQENQQVSDTVRREEAHLEQDGNPRVTGTGLNTDTTSTDTTTNM